MFCYFSENNLIIIFFFFLMFKLKTKLKETMGRLSRQIIVSFQFCGLSNQGIINFMLLNIYIIYGSIYFWNTYYFVKLFALI